MANKAITAIIIMLVISFSLIISTPMVILSTILSPYGIISEELPFYYRPSSPSIIDELNINTDLGNVEIKYITEPVDYCAKIDVKIEMIGSGLAGKSYFDYFNIIWQNTSSHVNFTMRLKAGINQVEILSLIRNLSITVGLKASVICDINLNVNVQGDVRITVPWGISVENILINVSKGDIQVDFSNCIVDGNLMGLIQKEGDLELQSNNVQYLNNHTWFLNTQVGDILLYIFQYTDINGNISGTITHEQGHIKFKYQDSSINNGAYFKLYYYIDDFPLLNEIINQVAGFGSNHSEEQLLFDLWSFDYPNQNNYNLLFNNSNGNFLELDLNT
jgi:hypothetical protein